MESILDAVIAPLHWLERSRGWRRRGLIALYLWLALAGCVVAWRELSFWRLPNAPEPFDAAQHGRIHVPDADNAMVAYRAIYATRGEIDTKGYDAPRKDWDVHDWSAAHPEVRRWATDHAADLKSWIWATDLPEALLVQPEATTMSTLLGPVHMLRTYVSLALLEGSRREQAGDLDGAWRMDRAALRASRHAGMHGGAIQRLIGSALLRITRPRVEAWADHPKVTPDQLRRAILDVEACAAMTSPASEMIRVEYFSSRDALKMPELWGTASDWGPYSNAEWYNHITVARTARQYLRREPERTARVLRLITAGILAQCDRPRAVRPKLAFPEFLIYDYDPKSPPPVRAISPEDLDAWAKASAMGSIGNFSSQILAQTDIEPGIFDALRLRMAGRAFAIERGRPPKTFGELVGPYLRALPEGIEPEDATNASPPAP